MISRSTRRAAIRIASTFARLAAVSGLVGLLENGDGVPNASSVFLLAVVVAREREAISLFRVDAPQDSGQLVGPTTFVRRRRVSAHVTLVPHSPAEAVILA